MAQMRLDKLLTHLNCGSRKEVQALIRAGRVSVEGQVVRDPAAKLDPETAAVSVDGQVQRYRAQRYYMLNKPAGVITASRDARHPTVLGLFPENERRGLFAVGRLDKDTEGLLIVTDDGALSHALMSPARHVSKVYEAEIEGEMAKDAVQRFAQGMTLKDGTVCRPAKLEHVPAACGSRCRRGNTIRSSGWSRQPAGWWRTCAGSGWGGCRSIQSSRRGNTGCCGRRRLSCCGRSRKMNRSAEKIAKKI